MTMQRSYPGLIEAAELPHEIHDAIPAIREDAMQAAFALIATRLEVLGYPVSGDVMPGEAERLDDMFEGFIRAMALNNGDVADLQDADEDGILP